MEDILDLYAEPYQPAFPVICFDEVPYQMVSEIKLPLPVRNGKPGRYDFEYRREGTCNLFMLLQTLAGCGVSKSPISEPNRISLGACRIWLKSIFQKPKRSGAFAMRDRLGSLLPPLRGYHVGAASFTLC